MYYYKIAFTKKFKDERLSDDDVYDLIDCYFGALINNGQVISGYELYTDNNDVVYLATVLPRENSLSDSVSNDYVKGYLEKVRQFFDVEFIKEGNNIEYDESCTCSKPSWYFLCAEYGNGESPLICGDCRKPVPLYEVPYIFNEKEHFSLLDWYRASKAMNTLWIHSLWDRFTYAQTALPDSKLNREGRKIAKALEKVLKAPVFYHIKYFCEPYDDDMIVPKGLPHDIPETCPKCKGEWTDDEKFRKCERCRLITDRPRRG